MHAYSVKFGDKLGPLILLIWLIFSYVNDYFSSLYTTRGATNELACFGFGKCCFIIYSTSNILKCIIFLKSLEKPVYNLSKNNAVNMFDKTFLFTTLAFIYLMLTNLHLLEYSYNTNLFPMFACSIF